MAKTLIGLAAFLAIAVAGLWVWWKTFTYRPPKGDMDRKEEVELWRLAERANRIMANLGPKYEIEDSDILSKNSQDLISEWRREFDHFTEKRQKEISA